MARSGSARLTSAPTVTEIVWSTRDGAAEHEQHPAGRVAAAEGQGHQLRLVAELGQEHHHEGGRDITHRYSRPAREPGRSRLRPSPHAPTRRPRPRRCCCWPRAATPATTSDADHGRVQGRAVDGRVTLVADDLRWDTDCLRGAGRAAHHRGRQPGRRAEPQRPPARRARVAGHRPRAGTVAAGARRRPRARAPTSSSATSTRTWWARSRCG